MNERISSVVYASYSATAAPGGAQKEQVRIAAAEFQPVHAAIVKLLSDLDAFEAHLKQLGAPYTPGTLGMSYAPSRTRDSEACLSPRVPGTS